VKLARPSWNNTRRNNKQECFAEVVHNILKEFKATGEIGDDELDGGVIKL
jgi:hypothetical protein